MNVIMFNTRDSKRVHLNVNYLVCVSKNNYIIKKDIINDEDEFYYRIRTIDEEYFVNKEEYENLIYVLEKWII